MGVIDLRTAHNLLGLLVLLLTLGGCVTASMPRSPESVVAAYFAAVKDLDQERARQYVAHDAQVGDLLPPLPQGVPVETKEIAPEGEAAESLVKLARAEFARLEVVVDESTISGDEATVTYHVTRTDPVPGEDDMTNLTRSLEAADLARHAEVIVDWYIDLLDSPSAVTTTYAGVAHLTRVDGKWQIESTSPSLNDVLRDRDDD